MKRTQPRCSDNQRHQLVTQQVTIFIGRPGQSHSHTLRSIERAQPRQHRIRTLQERVGSLCESVTQSRICQPWRDRDLDYFQPCVDSLPD